MKVKFAKDEICEGMNSPYWTVHVVPVPQSESEATTLAAELNAREEALAKVQAERDRLRAAVEQGIASLRLANQHCGCIADFDEEIADMTTALSAKGEGE